MEYVIVIAALVFMVGGYFLASIKSDNIFIKIWRVFWNFEITITVVIFKIMGYIPIMGIIFLWVSDFMDDHLVVRFDETDLEKEERRESNRKLNEDIMSDVERSTKASIEEDKRRKAEQAEYEAQREQERQDALRKRAYETTGDGDLQFNSDGSYVRRPGGEWERTSDVEKRLK